MKRIVDGKRYDTKKATLIADNEYWDGNNYNRNGRNQYLYRTPKGRYFFVNTTMWQGEQDSLNPCTEEEAVEAYENWLTEHSVPYEEAFPSREVEDA